MPSFSLIHWRADRRARLRELSDQASATSLLSPPKPSLEEENIRGYLLLLSAHFQGFCRDIYAECTQVVVSTVGSQLRLTLQQQFTANLKLDRQNPNHETLKSDFNRFGFRLDLVGADPVNHARLQDLHALNLWRNIAAHQGTMPSGGLPTIPVVRAWEASCDGLATTLDAILYNRIRAIVPIAPWIP